MDPELPFVARPAGGRATTDPVAAAAVQAWDLPAPEWIASGMNGVYRAGDAAIRVGALNGYPETAAELAGVLARAGVRVPRPLPLAPYVHGGGLVATAWEWLARSGAPVDWFRVGEMVARLHTLDPAHVPEGHPLPWCGSFPWWRLDEALAVAAGDLDAATDKGLRSAIERFGGWERLVGETVVCHGDVHWHNVVMLDSGPALLDWDLLCRGPVAWDHAPLLRWSARWGGPDDGYARFAAGYGRSLAGQPLAEALAELRLVAATLMRVLAGRDDDAARHEAQRRLRYWRGDPDAPPWTPM